MSNAELGATPHNADDAVKTARPQRNRRLRPTRSATRPATMSRAPKTTVYAFSTQESCASVAPANVRRRSPNAT